MTTDEKIYVLYKILIFYLEGEFTKEQLLTELKNFENE